MKILVAIILTIVATVVLILLQPEGAKAAPVGCSDAAFLATASTAIELEGRAYDHAREYRYGLAKSWAQRAWTHIRTRKAPCDYWLRRFRTLKMDLYLTLGAAYEALLIGYDEQGWYLVGKARWIQRDATAALNRA